MNKKELLKKLEKEIKSALDDCWKYYKADLKATGATSRKDLEDYLDGCDLQGWEDIGWFMGKISALEDVIRLLGNKD